MSKETRKQYYINSYNFKKIREKDGKLIFNEDGKVSYPISECIMFKVLYQVTGREYKNGEPEDNKLEDIFILRAGEINPNDEKQIERYEKLIKDGCYISIKNKENPKIKEEIHYKYGVKSSSMTRTQKTVFDKADINNKVIEYLTLGKKPLKCVTSKYITSVGLMLSTVDIIPILPRIAIIKDFERTIPSTVWEVKDYPISDEYKKEEQRYEEYKAKIQEAKKLFKREYLREHYGDTIHIGDDIKSIAGWKELGRKIKNEEVMKPYSYNFYGDNYFATYKKEQTEERVIPQITPETVGKEKVLTTYSADDENCPKINCFDGMGIMSFDFAKKLEEHLGLVPNSIQIRLPYIKSNVIRVDWKNWMLEHGIRTITDIFGKTYDIMELDMILTESCFKAKLEKTESMNPWLFENMQEYYDLLEKYGYDYFGIANYSHPSYENEFTPMTYQFINSTNLSYKDLKVLEKEIKDILKGVKRYDVVAVKLFLNILSNTKNPEDEENDEEEINEDDLKDETRAIAKAIELNERMIFDSHVQRFLYKKVKQVLKQMQIGRILIPSRFLFATGDVIAFMEHACGLDVKGFLKADEFYCASKKGEWITTRYPLCHFSEVMVGNYFESDNKYVKHLDNIIQFNTYDLSMCRMTEDYDGDKNYIIDANLSISDGRVIKDALEFDYPHYNAGDKATAEPKDFNIDSIVKFELHNLNQLTGLVTNYNTIYQCKAKMEGNLWKKDYESSICKYLQGEIIDSVKKGNIVEIPQPIKVNARKEPYFMKVKYGGKEEDYMKPLCALDYYSVLNNKRIAKLFPDNKDSFEYDKTYLDIRNVYSLMIDESRYTSQQQITYLNVLIPIFKEYSTARGELIQKGKDIDKMRDGSSKDDVKKIHIKKYGELYLNTRNKALEALGELNVKEEDIESVLASICTVIEYDFAKCSNENGVPRNKSFCFPWKIAPQGVLENIKINKGTEQTVVERVRDITEANILQLGQMYKITTKIRETKLNSPAPIIDNVVPLHDFETKLIGLHEDGSVVAEKLKDNEFILAEENERLILKDEQDNYIGVIRKEDYIRLDKGVVLKDYLNKRFWIKVDEVKSAKTIIITLDMVN